MFITAPTFNIILLKTIVNISYWNMEQWRERDVSFHLAGKTVFLEGGKQMKGKYVISN